MTRQKIAPAAIVALKRALTAAYWYRNDLRTFLSTSISDPRILASINWSGLKRDVVASVVDRMAAKQSTYGEQLIGVMLEVAEMTDFTHLQRLEGGAAKVREAREAVAALRELVAGHTEILEGRRKSEERKAAARERSQAFGDVQRRLREIRDRYLRMLTADHNERGYILEAIMRDLFELFDLDPHASFRVLGEQIDGAFTFDSLDYLFEGKWHAEPVGVSALDALDGKLSRKLDNALGLLLSINGVSSGGLSAYGSGGRRLILIMDGADLMAVLDGRISLPDLLRRKRRHASQTGNIFLTVAEILTGK